MRQFDGLSTLPSPCQSEAEALLDALQRGFRAKQSRKWFREARHSTARAESCPVWTGMIELGAAHACYPAALGSEEMPLLLGVMISELIGKELGPEAFTPCGLYAPAFLRCLDERAVHAGFGLDDAAAPTVGMAVEDDVRPATLSRHGGRLTLLGGKRFVRGGLKATHFVVIATDGSEKMAVLVSRHAPGVVATQEPMVDGTFATRLDFEDVALGASSILCSGEDCEGALRVADSWATVGMSAELLGLHTALLELTLEYLSVRRQFGKRLADFQALQHRIVDCFIQREMCRYVVHEAASALQAGATGDHAVMMASRAKARAGTAAQLMCREAIQMHGAMGFSDEGDVGLFAKRALVLAPWLGSADFHRRRFIAQCEIFPAEVR